MAKLKMPKQPKLGAKQSTWDKFEKKTKNYVAGKNEQLRRKGLKESLVAKIKV